MEDEGECRVVDEGVVGRSVARVHQTGIFAEGRVPGTVVAVLDDPMATVESQQPLGVGLFRGQRGHAIGHFDGFFAGLDLISLAGDAENLSDLGVVDQTSKGLQDLNPALLDAAMSLLVVFAEVGRRVPVPVDGLQGLEGFRGVALDREQVVGAEWRGQCFGWYARRPE